MCLLVDDPVPCRNPMWYEFPDQGHVEEIPNGFAESFADLCEQYGVAGKFSVIPCPRAEGRVDEGLPGVPDSELREFLCIVRERIAPRMDVSPELLTHNRAVDPDTLEPLEEREDAWAARQDERTLTRYISTALAILRSAGLEPNGVTSPWALGAEIEDVYARAISAALWEVCGVRVGWYFLHADGASPVVPPRVVLLNERERRGLVSLIPGFGRDPFWRTQQGEEPQLDDLISSDGSRGRLADLFHAGSPVALCTHWQSLFSNGTGTGLAALEGLCARIEHNWSDRFRWTPARELAQYAVATAAVRLESEGDVIRISSPFECPRLTLELPSRPGARLHLDGTPLEVTGGALEEGCWRRDGDRAIACFGLEGSVELSWRT